MTKKMKEKKLMAEQEDQAQTAIRMPKSWLERLDKIAADQNRPDLRIMRSDALRMAILAGIEVYEAKGKKR
jgi:predicted DNA-binding protein